MRQSVRPYRSVLYIPGSKARALEKARTLTADAIIFDLEDAVAPSEKDGARAALLGALGEGGYGRRARVVRVNGGTTPWGEDDLEAAIQMAPDAILIPKVDKADELADVAARLDEAGVDARLWAMIETPRGVLNAAAIAEAPRMEAFVMGTNDLAKELGCVPGPGRASLMTALQTCLLAAKAAGIVCVDGVFNAFRDEAGLRAEAEQGRSLGMDGKTLIHPAQIEIANAVFAPDADEIALAERRIAAFEAAEARGEGVAVVDGEIVENLHVETARATLAKVRRIKEMAA